MGLFAIISIIPLLAAFGILREKAYPIAIFFIALALLYHTSFISEYVTGWDVQQEYYYSSLVVGTGYWDANLSSNINSMLSTTMLASSLSLVSGIPLVWVFKMLYPLIYSLVPVCLYLIISNQFNRKFAFFSTYLIMSTFIFFEVMLDMPRQQVAELFMLMVVLLLTSRRVYESPVKVLLVLFLLSVVVSHYGITYIFLLLIVGAWALIVLTRSTTSKPSPIRFNLVLLYVMMTIIWYMSLGGSSAFNAIVFVGRDVASNLFHDLLTPASSQAVAIATQKAMQPMHLVTLYLYIVVQVVIFIGVMTMLRKGTKQFGSREYSSFCLMGLALLVVSVVIPYFSAAFSFSRLFQLTLFFLAPFFIIGVRSIGELIRVLLSGAHIRVRPKNKSVMIVVSVILLGFILFNSGFVYLVANEASSKSLDGSMDYPRFNTQEVKCCIWLLDKKPDTTNIYTDDYRGFLFRAYGNITHSYGSSDFNQTMLSSQSLLFLGEENTQNGRVMLVNWSIPRSPTYESFTIQNAHPLAYWIESSSRIFNDGDAQVYCP